jgi:hypothetical protein
MQDLYSNCNPKIGCKNTHLREWIIQAAKENDMWDFPAVKCGQTPTFPLKTITKYKQEIETGKDNFCL